MLTKAVHEGYILGGVVSSGGPCISHLLFAYDSLLFCATDKTEPDYILKILSKYEK